MSDKSTFCPTIKEKFNTSFNSATNGKIQKNPRFVIEKDTMHNRMKEMVKAISSDGVFIMKGC
jgi:hypothetical protein